MKKLFLPYNEVRNNAIKLAYRIYRDGFIPDVIYVPLRGGACPGNVISEYFKILREGKRPIVYAAVVARSRSSRGDRGPVVVDGWTYDPEHLRIGNRILIVDDIFDSGATLNNLTGTIMSRGIPREDIKLAVHDYKILKYLNKPHEITIQPDYYCNKYIIQNHDEEIWIHYLSHELTGLTEDEIKKYYTSEDESLAEAFKLLMAPLSAAE